MASLAILGPRFLREPASRCPLNGRAPRGATWRGNPEKAADVSKAGARGSAPAHSKTLAGVTSRSAFGARLAMAGPLAPTPEAR
jgi:hypothetical protein